MPDSHTEQTAFASSFKEGRDLFLSLCKRRNLPVRPYLHTDYKDPGGGFLATDAAWLGPQNARHILMMSCGTHGLEASTGSAIFSYYLSQTKENNLPEGVAILFVHAVNPYGWAYQRRGNESGIDLNRNFINHHLTHPSNPDYKKLHSLLTDWRSNPANFESFQNALQAKISEIGYPAVLNGLSAGQYDYADGLSFGGWDLAWSCQTFYRIAVDYLKNAEKVLHIDWHTGVGEFGEPFFILDENKGSSADKTCQNIWPEHPIHTDDMIDGLNVNYSGILLTGLKQALTNAITADVTGVTIEWGTYSVKTMIEALLMDNWLVHNNKTVPQKLIDQMRATLIERFCPSDRTWRETVLQKSIPLITQAIEGLGHQGVST